MIDIFTKYAVAIPLASRADGDVSAGVMEGFVKVGRKPQTIYCDGEGSLRFNAFTKFCQDEKIKLIRTLSLAYIVERFIRTLKMEYIEGWKLPRMIKNGQISYLSFY